MMQRRGAASQQVERAREVFFGGATNYKVVELPICGVRLKIKMNEY
jgi:hypothetical protein